jgi:hypothetical protein
MMSPVVVLSAEKTRDPTNLDSGPVHSSSYVDDVMDELEM